PYIGGDSGLHNARVSNFKGMPVLVAQKAGVTIALLCSHPIKTASVGYAGISDGWLDLAAHRRLTRAYKRADAGHVALAAEVAYDETELVLAVGFGATERDAAAKAWASLLDGFEAAKERYMAAWRTWQNTLSPV